MHTVDTTGFQFTYSIPQLYEAATEVARDFYKRRVFVGKYDDTSSSRDKTKPLSWDEVLFRVHQQVAFGFQTGNDEKKARDNGKILSKVGIIDLDQDQHRIMCHFSTAGVMLKMYAEADEFFMNNVIAGGEIFTGHDIKQVEPTLKYLDLSGYNFEQFKAFINVDAHKTILDRARMPNLVCSNFKANHSSMVETYAPGLDIRGESTLRGAISRGADLTNAVISGDLKRWDIIGANVEGMVIVEGSNTTDMTVHFRQFKQRLLRLHKSRPDIMSQSKMKRNLKAAAKWPDSHLEAITCEEKTKEAWLKFQNRK